MTDQTNHGSGDVQRKFTEALERKRQQAQNRVSQEDSRYRAKGLHNAPGQRNVFRRKTG